MYTVNDLKKITFYQIEVTRLYPYREGKKRREESSLIIPGDLGEYALQNHHKLFRWHISTTDL